MEHTNVAVLLVILETALIVKILMNAAMLQWILVTATQFVQIQLEVTLANVKMDMKEMVIAATVSHILMRKNN